MSSRSKYKKIILAGVGGQGVLTISRILGVAALRSGLNILTSEVHGMAQRGGSVVVHVKIGKGSFSPLVPEGSADLIAALEVYEAIRSLSFANENTAMLINFRCIPPPLPGLELPDPKRVIDGIRGRLERVYVLECEKLAEKAGSPLSANVVMLGAMAALDIIDLPEETYIEAIKEVFRGRLVDVNVQAFKLGYKHIKEHTPS